MIVLTSNNINTFCKDGVLELYGYFKADFINNKVQLKKDNTVFTINVKEQQTCTCPFFNDEKQEVFWHMITTDRKVNQQNRINPCKNKKEKMRKYDEKRAKRIHWIKKTIESWQDDDNIKHFYQKRGNKVNLILWQTNQNFLVIIRKLSNISDKYLVTSYILYQSETKRYQKQLKEYEGNKPNGLEWF